MLEAPALRPQSPEIEPVVEPAAPPPCRKVPRWILQVRKIDMVEIAEVLGLEVAQYKMRPCPHCGEEVGAEIYQNKHGWLLWRCGECQLRDRGNVDLVSYALAGEKAGDLSPDQKVLLRQWFADQGWCEPTESRDG